MKKFLLLSLLILGCLSLKAQEEGKFRIGWNLGGAYLFGDGFGVVGDMDFRYNILYNVNVGIRVGGGGMLKYEIGEDKGELEMNINASFLAMCDYYLRAYDNSSAFAPFIGAGFGYYILGKASLSTEAEELSAGTTNAFGLMLRTGFEVSRFRLGLEYHLIPPTTLRNALNETIGQSKNSYLGLMVGFYIGGGKWKKSMYGRR